MISNYEHLEPGVDKDAYGNAVARFISTDTVAELLMDSGEWYLIPEELKRKYNSKTNKRAHALGRGLALKRKLSPKSVAKESISDVDVERLDLLHSSVENSLYSFLETINSLD